MKLTLNGISDCSWANAGIEMPAYSVEQCADATRRNPHWVHFGAGNIFRMFLCSIADRLLDAGDIGTGIICVETFDREIIDAIYRPHDNLSLAVTLNGDGSTRMRVIGSVAEAIAASDTTRDRLCDIFANPELQMVTFTITEKGYALRDASGQVFPSVLADIEAGPDRACSVMPLLVSLLLARFRAGRGPLALVSMDNVSHNGDKLRDAILEIANAWASRGYVDRAFLAYLEDGMITYPLMMIDKITPRPDESIRARLESLGISGMDIRITERKTYIAPFVNAEGPEYLVVEDRFPNGRPTLEKAGVYMTDREKVNAAERMKVTVCLNPIHTALAPYGCLLGLPRFSDVIRDPELHMLAHRVGYMEGMPVVKDPGILSPEAFLKECLEVRFPNPYIPDTPQRIVVDTSQMVGIRFGETIREYVKRDGHARSLIGIPLAIAGWFRYMLAVDDAGKSYELSPDPMNETVARALCDVRVGNPETYTGQLRPFLSNPAIFGSDLYAAGIGERIEALFREEIRGPGTVRNTLISTLREKTGPGQV